MTPLLEMLLKLFCHYIKHSSSMDTLKDMLKELEKTTIAVNALDKLLKEDTARFALRGHLNHNGQYTANAFRVYSTEEYDKLSTKCLGLLHELEKNGIITSKERDLVLLQVTLKDKPPLELEEFKRLLQATFKDKFSSIEHWWLQTWPFNELEHIKVH